MDDEQPQARLINQPRIKQGECIMTKRISWLLLSACLPFLLSGAPLLADEVVDEIADENAVKCISIRNVRRTVIVDDLNIIFFLAGNKTYHNILPRRCNSLAREDRFSYKVSASRLCDIDMIRVLYQGGAGLQEGNSCRLGLFHPISKEDAEAIIEGPDELPQAEPIPLPDPEEIGADSKESGDEQQNR